MTANSAIMINHNQMTLTFFANFLNHHQVKVADELYKLLGDGFRFVATMPLSPMELKGGEDYSARTYCILAALSPSNHDEALRLARDSDACVFGACAQEYAVERARFNPDGISFENSERWLKKGMMNILSPVFLKWYRNYWRYYHNANFFKLCSSAFASIDDNKLGCYRNKHFKWGYFTEVKKEIPTIQPLNNGCVRIMWCARFLKLKHPELPIMMAHRLKKLGYKFKLDYYGSGDEEKSTQELSKKVNVDDMVEFHGAMPNAEILAQMSLHDIFLFTSNKLEGWGAVANEALSNGCVLIASDHIGSSPYLIKDGINGFRFKSGSIESLTDNVKWLLDHPDTLQSMRRNAFETMRSLWNPCNAAHSLLKLIDDLKNKRDSSIVEGPCSKA